MTDEATGPDATPDYSIWIIEWKNNSGVWEPTNGMFLRADSASECSKEMNRRQNGRYRAIQFSQPLPSQRAQEALQAENAQMKADLYAIGDALGIGAKPYSGHDAVDRDFLPAIAALREIAQARR